MTTIPEITLEVTGLTCGQIRTKLTAYRELTGYIPKVYLEGEWYHKQTGMIACFHRDKLTLPQAHHFGNIYITVWSDVYGGRYHTIEKSDLPINGRSFLSLLPDRKL